MQFKKKLINLNKLYIIFFSSVLFIIVVFNSSVKANSFKVKEIEVSEQFDLNFNKKKVFNKAFREAFLNLTYMITTSSDIDKVSKTPTSTIQSLIDSFNLSDEKFIDDKYYAKFNVNFNKKKTLNFFESNNIFPSVSKLLDILVIPVLVDVNSGKITSFDENPIFQKWDAEIKKYHLLNYILPTEDIEDRNFLEANIETIEDYSFEEIISKYDLKNYIINIIYKDKNNLKVLSKINLDNDYKILTKTYDDVDLEDDVKINQLIYKLKTDYEDNWKKLNIINTSIKLPITISLSTKENIKIIKLEKILDNLDLVSNYYVISFNNKDIFYKIIYNGAPDRFLLEIKRTGLTIKKNNFDWRIE